MDIVKQERRENKKKRKETRGLRDREGEERRKKPEGVNWAI